MLGIWVLRVLDLDLDSLFMAWPTGAGATTIG